MKVKEKIETPIPAERPLAQPEKRPRSLRPMRSMVAVRSLRPKTTVAVVKEAERAQRD
jgi:hypothetical protein